MNIWRIMICLGRKRPSKPQKWSKILKNVQTILARVLEVFVCQTAWCMLLHCKQSCKETFKNDKDLGRMYPKVSDIGLKAWISNVNQNQESPSYIKYSISLFFWSLLKGLKQTLMDQVWDHYENFLVVTNDLININKYKK